MIEATSELAGNVRSLRERLQHYLEQMLGGQISLSPLKRYPSGFSWITFGFSIKPGFNEVSELILRLGPQNGLYAPYSAEPQFAALAALKDTVVPVPRAYLWSDDPAILGDPFFISEKFPGAAPIPWGSDDGLTTEHRQTLGAQFADALGAIHSTDWSSSGLAKFAVGLTRENAALHQLDKWEADYRRWALRSYPMLHYVFGWLRARMPVAPQLSIVHGDYRLGNFLAVDGQITAILDWELVHIGDPHEDLAWVCLPQYRGGTPLMSKLVSREELYRRHETKTGLPVSAKSMHYYSLFSLVKLAVTHIAGVYAFERHGFHDLRLAAFGTQIAPTLRQIEKMLEVDP